MGEEEEEGEWVMRECEWVSECCVSVRTHRTTP